MNFNIPKLNLDQVGGVQGNSMTSRDNDLRKTQPNFDQQNIDKPKSARGPVDRRTDPGGLNSARKSNTKRISKLHQLGINNQQLAQLQELSENASSQQNDGDMMMGTDLDYFEGEIARLKEEKQEIALEMGEQDDQNVLAMDMEMNHRKAIEMSQMLLNVSKKWFH